MAGLDRKRRCVPTMLCSASWGFARIERLTTTLQLTDQAMSYAGGSRVVVPKKAASAPGSACACKSHEASQKPAAANNGAAGRCGCEGPKVTESKPAAARALPTTQTRASFSSNGHPDFTRMSPAERLAYHRERLGLGR